MICEIIPNPGKIKMYTSGWPKNQNKCWYKMGSPPPAGLKKEVLKFRSVRSIVMAPAKTGRDKRRRIAVSKTDQTKRGIRSKIIPGERILIIVVIKFAEPKIEEAPAKCNEKIAKSTDGPAWAVSLAKGG